MSSPLINVDIDKPGRYRAKYFYLADIMSVFVCVRMHYVALIDLGDRWK